MVDILLLAGIYWLFYCPGEISYRTTAPLRAIHCSGPGTPPSAERGRRRRTARGQRQCDVSDLVLARGPRLGWVHSWEELTMPERVEITGPAEERYVEILSPRALELLVMLHDALADRRAEALAARRRRQAQLSGGAMLDFLHETEHIRADDSWRVAPPAPGLIDRRVEITGPTDRKMTINALNSGANVWLADFDD